MLNGEPMTWITYSSIQTVGWLPSTMEYTMLNVPIRFAVARNAE